MIVRMRDHQHHSHRLANITKGMESATAVLCAMMTGSFSLLQYWERSLSFSFFHTCILLEDPDFATTTSKLRKKTLRVQTRRVPWKPISNLQTSFCTRFHTQERSHNAEGFRTLRHAGFSAKSSLRCATSRIRSSFESINALLRPSFFSHTLLRRHLESPP